MMANNLSTLINNFRYLERLYLQLHQLCLKIVFLISQNGNKFGLELVFILMINLQAGYKNWDIEILTIETTICKNKILVAGIYKRRNLS